MKRTPTKKILEARWERLRELYQKMLTNNSAAVPKDWYEKELWAMLTKAGRKWVVQQVQEPFKKLHKAISSQSLHLRFWELKKRYDVALRETQTVVNSPPDFPSGAAEVEIKEHFFKLWRTELALGLPKEKFGYNKRGSEQQQSEKACCDKYPEQFHLVSVLAHVAYPTPEISLGPVIRNGVATMEPIPYPGWLPKGQTILWVPCLLRDDRDENTQRMANVYNMLKKSERFYLDLAAMNRIPKRRQWPQWEKEDIAKFYKARRKNKFHSTARHF